MEAARSSSRSTTWTRPSSRCAPPGLEILQVPVDQPYGVRDAAVRDPSGNHLRLSQPLAGGLSVPVSPACSAAAEQAEDRLAG
ncbi:MAG TPA: hypothetical protein VHF26_23995 [Trebonia sp.]|nr:hypothetical protein [Trebonia sp.]